MQYNNQLSILFVKTSLITVSLNPLQGWLNEEQTHLLLNDELDELYGPNPHTRSLIWNVESLEKPELTGSFFSSKESTDHNLYIR
jgi:hypothetical protein